MSALLYALKTSAQFLAPTAQRRIATIAGAALAAALCAPSASAGASVSAFPSPPVTESAPRGHFLPTDRAPKLAPVRTAQKPAASQPTSTPWAINCSNNQGGTFACEMAQALVDGKTRKVILLVSIKKQTDGKSSAAVFRALHGVYIPAGLTVQIDNRTAKVLAFQRSDVHGVYAVEQLDKTTVAELKRGRALGFSMEFKKGAKVTLNAPLAGFAVGYDRVMAAE